MTRLSLRHRLPEVVLALAVLASFGWTLYHVHAFGYLPQPFVFDTNDSLMDWFNPAYWANNPGVYDVWRSIYPPLSFAFLDLTSLPGCYLQSPFYARDCDWLARGVILGTYGINVLIAWICFRRVDPYSAPMRTIAIAIGLPMLFTLERGNLILIAFAFFMIAHGPVTRSRRWHALSAAVTINFKPYLLLPVLALGIRRDWRALEAAGIATIAIYLASLAWVGSGTPAELASNTAHWVVFQGAQVWNEVNYSTSYAPLTMFRKLDLPVMSFVPSRIVETIEWLVPIAIRSTQLIALIALAAAWLQPRALPAHRVAALFLGAYLVTQSPGGYTQLFLIFLILLEKWERAGPATAIACAYLLCIAADWPLATILDVTGNSWLTDRSVTASFGLTAGHFLRPGLILVIVWALSLDSLARAVRAHRERRPSFGLAAA